jgi:hypothetical protein
MRERGKLAGVFRLQKLHGRPRLTTILLVGVSVVLLSILDGPSRPIPRQPTEQSNVPQRVVTAGAPDFTSAFIVLCQRMEAGTIFQARNLQCGMCLRALSFRQPMATTAADVLVKGLIDWGVDIVFGIPGDGINGIMEALRQRQREIRFIQVRHEESAAFMACGYAKFTGRLGVCLATSGPGGIHLLNGLYDAKLDGHRS